MRDIDQDIDQCAFCGHDYTSKGMDMVCKQCDLLWDNAIKKNGNEDISLSELRKMYEVLQ